MFYFRYFIYTFSRTMCIICGFASLNFLQKHKNAQPIYYIFITLDITNSINYIN